MSTLDGTPEAPMSQPPEPVYPGSPSPQDTPPSPQAPQTSQASPARPLDRVEPLNLSHRPFLNSRPVVRVSLLLLLLGVVLLLWNVVQFQRYLSESADKRAQIEQGDREVSRQQQVSAELQKRLGALDLEQINQRVEFLNEVIAERTFSWTLLLDRMAEVQPNDVRLLRLTPKVESSERRGQARRSGRDREETAERRIPLVISGESRSDEALLQFVDNLFAHPAFVNPNPSRDERLDEAGNQLKFDLNVQYVPGGTAQGVVVEEIPVTEGLSGTSAAPNALGNPRNPGGNRP